MMKTREFGIWVVESESRSCKLGMFLTWTPEIASSLEGDFQNVLHRKIDNKWRIANEMCVQIMAKR